MSVKVTQEGQQSPLAFERLLDFHGSKTDMKPRSNDAPGFMIFGYLLFPWGHRSRMREGAISMRKTLVSGLIALGAGIAAVGIYLRVLDRKSVV